MKLKASTLFSTILALGFARLTAQPVLPAKQAIEQLQIDVPDLMHKAGIPGMSVALIRNGKMIWTGAFGVMNANTRKPVTKETVFEAASLSKCVFAYGVLKLADQGKLNLDTPLTHYLGNNYDVPDPRINLVTARHVLTHSSGFPNWREFDNSKILQIHFNPGAKWSYSGEGFVYLSKVVEKITGMSLEDFMQQTVLKPLGMNSSSYVWSAEKYGATKAYRDDDFGKVTGRNENGSPGLLAVTEDANAAASLTTNATDYSKFIIAVLNGTGLKSETLEVMLSPGIRVTQNYPELAWGLGVGLETMQDGTWFCHLGDDGDAKAFYMASVKTKNAVVYFADGFNGLSIERAILADALGGKHPWLDNFGYEPYNSPVWTLVRAIIVEGASAPLERYRNERQRDTTQRINEWDMNRVGYKLLRLKKLDDALAVLRQNTEDFPASYHVWDTYAEAYMAKGDKEMAITYYQKSLELNPKNENGKKMLEKLQGGKN